MAYSQAFLDKVAKKPEYLTEREKAKVFAGPGGWYMKNGNPDAAPELLINLYRMNYMYKNNQYKE